MTCFEIDQAIADITKEKYNECKKRLEAIPRENTAEKKAVQIELGMYTFCCDAGLLFMLSREDCMTRRLHIMGQIIPRYPALNNIYSNLSDDEKTRFAASLQAEIFIRDTWLNQQYAELMCAKEANHTQSIFELNIKIGAVKGMFAAWEAWRIENNVYPHIFEEA